MSQQPAAWLPELVAIQDQMGGCMEQRTPYETAGEPGAVAEPNRRVLIEVVQADGGGWEVTVDDSRLHATLTQAEAIALAREYGRAGWKSYGIRSEVKVHGRDGRYKSSGSTYGKDPVASPG